MADGLLSLAIRWFGTDSHAAVTSTPLAPNMVAAAKPDPESGPGAPYSTAPTALTAGWSMPAPAILASSPGTP